MIPRPGHPIAKLLRQMHASKHGAVEDLEAAGSEKGDDGKDREEDDDS